MSDVVEIRLAFGALSPDMQTQLAEIGYTVSDEDNERFYRWNKYLANLCINGVVTDGERQKIINRIGKKVTAAAYPVAGKDDA